MNAKSILAIVICLTGVVLAEKTASTIGEKDKVEKAKVTLAPYGFLKGEMIYSTNGVEAFGNPTIVTPVLPTSSSDNFLSFTAQHSRIGLKGSADFGKMEVGGRVEIDFFSNINDANTKPRLRLAYAWCKPLKGLDIRIGQRIGSH